MNLFQKFTEAQKFFKDAGINFESIFDLISGKASGKTISKTVTPLLIKVDPAIDKALTHLAIEHQQECHLTISKGTDEAGRPLTALSVTTINPETGQVRFLETIPFYMVADYITDKIDASKKAETTVLEANQQKLIA